MKRIKILTRLLCWGGGGAMLMASAASQAIVAGDLLTNANGTTDWQNCAGSDVVTAATDQFDPAHLENSGCAYRETPIEAGTIYKMTCGISSFKYSSMTLAFLNDNGDTLASETTEIYEDSNGGAYSVTATAPAGATIGAVGIYGLAGSGFQDCTLLSVNPVPEPEDGSIAGATWFDLNADTQQGNGESMIGGTPVSLLLNGAVIAQTQTDNDGAYYFGGLDLGECYRVQFLPADPTVAFTAAGGDNDAVISGGTLDICLTAAVPNLTGINAGFVAVPPPAPPRDYAVCGMTWMQDGDVTAVLANVAVTLSNTGTGEHLELTSGANGGFAFGSLAAGTYKLSFTQTSGFTFIGGTPVLAEGGNFVDATGMSAAFTLPADGNTAEDDACTLRFANAGQLKTVVTLDPTVAMDDEIGGFVGDALSVQIIANDTPCDGAVEAVDLIGHNVPGTVTYNAATQQITITGTTASGTYSIDYGLRGACGSYDTAAVVVVLEDAPPPPPPMAPDAPAICHQSIGKLTGTESGVHVDLYFGNGINTHAEFLAEYRFYDADMNLLYTGMTSEAGTASWGIYWRKREHGLEVLDVAFVTAVENGVESNPTECISRNVTPIALDVDGSGRVEKVAGEFSFDITGNGIPDRLAEWVSPNDGMLIYRDFGKKISGEHLFGDTGGKFTDGFAKLAILDTDNNGSLSEKELQTLAIWTDRNSNAIVDEGEISSLSSHSIESLSVEHYKFATRATLDNGDTMLMRDLWLPMLPVTQASR